MLNSIRKIMSTKRLNSRILRPVLLAAVLLLVGYVMVLGQRPYEDTIETELLSAKCPALLERLRSDFIPIQTDFIRRRQGKALIWKCGDICGGFGDRLRGIISTFLLAVLTDRAFLIDHSRPANLADFFDFHPSLGSSWKFQQSFIDGMDVTSEFNIDQYKSGKYRYRTENFHDSIKSRVHIMQTNIPVQSYLLWNPHLEENIRRYGLDKINYIDLTGCLMSAVLSPHGEILTAFQRARRYLDNYYVIGLQIRTGGDNTEVWKDDERVKRSEIGYFWDCAQLLENKRQDSRPVKWFITTDSEKVRQSALEKFGDKVYQVEGDIVHIDKFESAAARRGMHKTLMDFLILSSADRMVISRSNFAEVAALRRFHRAIVYPDECTVSGGRTDFTRWWHVDAE